MASFDIKNYTWEWERPVFLYYIYIFNEAWLHNDYCLPLYTIFTYEKGRANGYLHRDMLNKSGKKIISQVEANGKYFKDWNGFVYKTTDNLNQLCDKLEKIDFSKQDNENLLSLFNKMYKYYRELDGNVTAIRNSNRELQAKLMAKFNNAAVVSKLLATSKKSLFAKEHEDMLKIAAKKKAAENVNRLLEKHIKKYFYLSCGFFDEESFSRKDFNDRLEDILRRKETLEKFNHNFKKISREKEKLLNILKPDSATRRIIGFGSECVYLKDFIRGNLSRMHYFNKLLFIAIAKKFGGKWQDIANLTPSEIRELLQGKRKIEKRETMILYSDEKGIKWLAGKKAKLLVNDIKKHSTTADADEIVGTIANNGKVVGQVKIILKASDLGKSKNFVLVAPMTTPDLMPAIRRAIAVITDEGGITSHAAIISREMGIPCIIGTRIATKVLKDGDLVEVDANKGIIKIIK